MPTDRELVRIFIATRLLGDVSLYYQPESAKPVSLNIIGHMDEPEAFFKHVSELVEGGSAKAIKTGPRKWSILPAPPENIESDWPSVEAYLEGVRVKAFEFLKELDLEPYNIDINDAVFNSFLDSWEEYRDVIRSD